MKLTLPLPPNRANAREHWRVTHRKKVAYYEKAEMALTTQYTSRVPGIYVPISQLSPQRMRLSARFYLWNKMDRGNLTARLKWIEDVLVNYGLLVDDNEKWLDLQMPTQVIDRKNQRVEIELTPCIAPPKDGSREQELQKHLYAERARE